ncbi:hypothetical protein QJS10_CPB19g00306 [Acorus calamus]|uniref:Uncharacterized protein n=1 Tax=Acorus calamus TaxID=4465 RepID=A0AAV9CJL1_ACOCL|nr:hypothetical protein QJS10_CPB19g00306 [Acorus calamus]
MAQRAWRLLAGASDLASGCSSLVELWRAGRSLRARGDRSPTAKISQQLIPAMMWSLWTARSKEVLWDLQEMTGEGKKGPLPVSEAVAALLELVFTGAAECMICK